MRAEPTEGQHGPGNGERRPGTYGGMVVDEEGVYLLTEGRCYYAGKRGCRPGFEAAYGYGDAAYLPDIPHQGVDTADQAKFLPAARPGGYRGNVFQQRKRCL